MLGAGGMGIVLQAEDTQLQRRVALKVMRPALATNSESRQRFLREARAAACLEQDHIVTIYQVGEAAGLPFLAMQFLKGESLEARLNRDGALPVPDVLHIGRQVALGLAAAHEQGLIHRDIKPGNIWLETTGREARDRGRAGGDKEQAYRVKILDFGLVRAADGHSRLTQTGAIVGTPAYMAPEQGRGQELDARCDLFSLGCVLYRMTTGRPAFSGSDAISTLVSVMTTHPHPAGDLNPELPAALSNLIFQLLAKEPMDRPASAQAVVKLIEAVDRDYTAACDRENGGAIPGAVPTSSSGSVGRSRVRRACHTTAAGSGRAPATPPSAAAARYCRCRIVARCRLGRCHGLSHQHRQGYPGNPDR